MPPLQPKPLLKHPPKANKTFAGLRTGAAHRV
ncbi:hypothetical protein DFR52_105292 [Hoeflea marina]|uniref:Uncharacterized protein n=1 Tax=Hoeflea marina TaxID=274592 RepID=A0A317PET6_9HYPH|nr:hypothetical protein DFR52_105292 [Hoeflea marina]